MQLSRSREMAKKALAALIVVVLLVQARGVGDALPLDDYQAYWSVSQQLLSGQDPYDLEALMARQVALGHDEEDPQVMWNPPYALPLVLPCGLLPYGTSRLVWLALCFGLVLASIELLWRLYDGGSERRLVGLIAGAAFLPVAIVLREGQIGPWQLLGVAGLLHFGHRERWWLAGACLPLVGIKPHSVHLIWPALVVWTLWRRELRVAGGALIVTLVLCGITLLFDPQVFSHYRDALGTRGVEFVRRFPTATLASTLRLSVGWEHTWPVKVVPALGWLWWATRCYGQRSDPPRWEQEAPLLILVSLVSAPYSWTHHLIFALPAVLHGAAIVRRQWNERGGGARAALAAYVALNLAALGIALTSDEREMTLWWLASAYLVLYVLVRRLEPGREPAAPDVTPTAAPAAG